MRLRADLYVAALMRRAQTAGASVYLRRRGAPEAGAIFIRIDRLDGRNALMGPAPQAALDEGGLRRFERLHREEWIDGATAEARLSRELRFDPDLWVVDIEDPAGRDFYVPG